MPKKYFESKGFSLGVAQPIFDCSMEYYKKKNKRVQSIKLEINRRLCLNEPSNENSLSNHK
jgi:hypothetical protein